MLRRTRINIALLAVALFLLLAVSAVAQPPTHLPWRAGVSYLVTQGNGGGSHGGSYTRYAWDFGLPNGTPVLSVAPGRVSRAGWDTTGYGNTIVICYGDGTCSRYAHLSSIAVSVGQSIGQGQEIGRSGNTGYSTGPHLHYSLENGGGGSLASSFAEAGVPRSGQRPVSQNRPGSSSPQFTDVHVYSSQTLDVAAGDRVRATVTALYQGPAPIPCGQVNLGVRGDAPAKFADHAAGFWPKSTWRSPNRAAAVGCSGNLDPGEHARWDLDFRLPTDTPPGTYLTGVYAPLRENAAGGWSNLQIPISVRVRGSYNAAFAGQEVTPLVAPGSTGKLTVALKNTGQTTWRRGEVNLGTRGDAAFPFADSSWGGSRNRIRLTEEAVRPGQVGHFTANIAPPAGTKPTRLKQYFAPVAENKYWFGAELGIYLTIFVGDPDHLPYTAEDYGAKHESQTYVSGPLQRGDRAEVKVTYRNTGQAVLFATGRQAVHLRGTHPNDRGSGFLEVGNSRVIGGNQGVKMDQDRVEPGELFSFTLPIRVADSVTPGKYQEYFRPVVEHLGWFGPDDVFWPFEVTVAQPAPAPTSAPPASEPTPVEPEPMPTDDQSDDNQPAPEDEPPANPSPPSSDTEPPDDSDEPTDEDQEDPPSEEEDSDSDDTDQPDSTDGQAATPPQ